jgi:PAS domain S-box-containing protein
MGGGLLSCGVALAIWYLWPVMHEDPFSIFIAAVIVAARFFGFGPAILCTATSAVALEYVLIRPSVVHGTLRLEFERLVVFVVVSVLTAGLARQRSRAEKAATEARDRMAAIVESSRDAILSTTPEGIITSWNRGAEQLYGYSAEEALGQHISLVAPPDRVFEIKNHIARLKRGEQVESFRTERMHKDGTRVSVLLSISPLRARNGAVIGTSAIARDVTAQQQAEEALRRNERLATAGRLAATVAHEINNPLEAVTNLLYLARSDPEHRDEYLALTETEVQRVAAIAQQTLGFVREASSPVRIDIAAILDQVVQLYARKLQDAHVVVERKYEEGLLVEGFPGELRQLFANLIMNATEAMGTGGKVQIRASHRSSWSWPKRPGIRITIADRGSGISHSELPHIFEPFFTTKRDLGTGLGLWLSHGVVEKHGGSIRVRSRVAPPVTGTVFSVFLPNVIETPKAAQAQLSAKSF